MLNKILPSKLAISLFKWILILFLVNIFIINPLGKVASKAAASLYDNEIVKIASLDFISNPLTFIRLAKHAIEKNKLENASLYLDYAEVIGARYNYPPSVKNEIVALRAKLKQVKNP